MFTFRWKTLESCEANNDALALWEVAAIFRGHALFDDISIDRDAAVEMYISTFVAEDSREDYRSEPQLAEDEMLEVFSSGLKNLVEGRIAELGAHYPLVLDASGNALTSKPWNEITSVGGGYLGLQFYRALHAGLIEVEDSDVGRGALISQFNRWFPKLLEVLAGYAVSGEKAGVPHLTSEVRSSQKLHSVLGALCRRIEAGVVTNYQQWSAEQKAANDGGVDCIVHVGGPGMPGTAFLVLVGATVQATQINHKIVDTDAIRRFGDFFAIRPGALFGALVRPCDADPLTKEKCATRSCLLYTYDDIWRNIGKRNEQNWTKRYFGRLDAQARRLLKDLEGAILIDDYSSYTLKFS
ncbi:hypothetical protein [Rhizobium alvei]|uniref:Uncharacterized protein n=1 Tax=Rhizobium alvei TaxID=1132659 RepID=A0ABT8YJY1_9HYPH|nr:hypothetical protein [Rhizobium alvei]MDO6963992.1 hypothetical protein [Rhizobium alvei]